MPDLYEIRRYYRDKPYEVVVRGLTLQQAQDHCNRDDTCGEGWFDGYAQEDAGVTRWRHWSERTNV